MMLNEKIFREYDIRGVADRDLTDEVIAGISRAIGTAIRRKGGRKVTVGRDCRLSSPRITSKLIEGLLSTGVDVIDIGIVPTPLSYFSVFHLNTDGGVMVTGSHNPGDQNGLKICIGKSTIHGEDIQELKKIMVAEAFESGKGSVSETNIIQDYVKAVAKTIPHPLGIKLVVDSGNGTGGIVAPALLRHLGCEVIELFSKPDGHFPNHHPDPSLPENLQDVIAEVKRTGAIAGIAFDGDADRIGVVGPTGRALFGDELLVIFARAILKEHPGAKIISEVKASHRLFNDIREHGGEPILWKVGHSLIKAKMKELGAKLAGEMSGHMFFNDRYYGFDDAVYAAARLAEILALTKKTPEELIADLPPAVSTPEIRVDCPDERKFWVVDQAKAAFEKAGLKVNGIDGARVEFADGWGLVRASNTQPVLVYRFEATSERRLKEIRDTLEGVVNKLLA